ncbi:MAG: ROK family protein [Acidobacteriota bacterium]|nr:ROK family protein [Acidobacteriota bacterium]MDE3139555.1 ROK family protein [Acidobacteriota bacterium]
MSDVAVGLDVGGTKALALLVSRDGEILDELRSSTPHDAQEPAGVATAKVLVSQIETLAQRHGLDPVTLPIGIGMPGMVRRDGRLAFAPNLHSASGASFPELLHDLLGACAVHMENDGNCAALAEFAWGAGRGIDNFVMVTLGTGIGGGIIANGELVRGQNGFGGEIGHMAVEARGALCGCGGQGCWERYASGGGLARLTTQWASEGRLPTLTSRRGSAAKVSGEDVTRAASEGLDEAVALMNEVAWWLARGLANLVAILDTGHFVIGGGLSVAADLLLPPARDYLADLVFGYAKRPQIVVTTSRLTVHAGALGAAKVALDRQP